VIGLAITALVLVDPLLVRSTGFQLSSCAAVGIVVLAPRFTAAIPGPTALREALGVTLAAQLGVAPVLLATFGPVPVASLPANLLCVPVAGLVMIWGLTAGLLAGIAGGPWASLVHQPTRVALGWLELVAQRTAQAPLGELRVAHVVALAAGMALTVTVDRAGWRRLGAVVAVGAVLSAVVAAHAPAPLREAPAPGVVRWHGRGVDVIVLGGGRSDLGAPTVLESLRRSGVDTIDLLVVADASVPVSVVDLVARAHRIGTTHTPVDGAATVDLGSLTVRIVAVPGRLVVDAVPRGP
jgi:hypothetical protein